MQILKQNEYERAAAVFASGFLSDPAFSLVLQGIEDAQDCLKTYFLNYMTSCKELLLYKHSETKEAYLCLYRYDTVFDDFDIPLALQALEQFQILEKHYKQRYAVLDIMAVAPASRGKGLAGEMIECFVSYCKKENLIPLVEVFSPSHLQLYRAHGFEVTFSACHRGVTTYVLEYKQ